MNNSKRLLLPVLAGAIFLVTALMPATASAQYRYNRDRREQTKNEWRNLSIAAGLVALVGLANDDDTLLFAGTAGALYSANRYEQDRRSQRRCDRARYQVFRDRRFTRNGYRYERRTVYRSHRPYYQFVRCR